MAPEIYVGDPEGCDRRGCDEESAFEILTESPKVSDDDYTEWHICEGHAPTVVGEWRGVMNIMESREVA